MDLEDSKNVETVKRINVNHKIDKVFTGGNDSIGRNAMTKT